MESFSVRNGYDKPSDVIIREKMTPEIQNIICNCYNDLYELFAKCYCIQSGYDEYKMMEMYLWTEYLNKKRRDYIAITKHYDLADNYICNDINKWYDKLNFIEFTISYLRKRDSEKLFCDSVADLFVEKLNSGFERLRFGYMIFHDLVVPNNAKVEMDEVDDALQYSPNHTQMHLHKALEFYSKRPEPDYPNSIKESISAVEAEYTPQTGKNVLGKAIDRIRCNGNGAIPSKLMNALEEFYKYSNMHEIGARHAKKDEDTKSEPKEAEAWLMLVCCSAFINYLRKKPSIFA